MSQENVEIARRTWEHVLLADNSSEVVGAAFEVHDHDLPDAGVYRGPEGVARWGDAWAEAWDDWKFETEEYIDVGDRVVVIARMWARGKGSGVTVQRHDGLVITVRNGEAVRLDYFSSKAEALEAVGLRE
jgi:ketosteroid isomerase-like protein